MTGLEDQAAVALYDLNHDCDMKSHVSDIVDNLNEQVPPALSAEYSALVAPVIQAALSTDTASENSDSLSHRRNKMRRHSDVVIVKNIV